MNSIVEQKGGLETAFRIVCGECTLSAARLPRFTPTALPDWVEYIGIRGWETPAQTIKYLPAVAAAMWIMRVLFPRYAKDGRICVLVESSGNFLDSLVTHVKLKGLPIDIIGVVSSKLPAGKRARIDRHKIKVMTELDLARELLLPQAGNLDLHDLMYRYGDHARIPVVDQYNCGKDNWNAKSYLPIVDSVHENLGEIAAFASTAGSKGKAALAAALHAKNGVTQLWATFPLPGFSFPGGTGILEIGKRTNEFGIVPTNVLVDEISAMQRSVIAYKRGFPGGITFGAEYAAAEQMLLYLMVSGKLEGLRRKSDGRVIVLLIASDTIFPYVEDIRAKLREMDLPDLLAA